MRINAVSGKLLLCFATAGLAAAGAATYRVTLYQPSVIDGKELKPGDYKVEVNEHAAIIQQGKTSIEAAVKSETTDKKFGSTSVKYNVSGGKNNVEEIRLGGTKTKLVFESGRAANGGV